MTRIASVVLLLSLAAVVHAEPPPVDLEALAAAHPEDPDLAWAYARALVDEQRHAEAARALERLRARWPDRYPDAAYLHARALLDAGQLENALALVEAALAQKPEEVSLELLRSAILLRLARPADAQQSLERAVASDARFADLTGDLHRVLDREPGERIRARQPAARGRLPLSFQIYGGAEYDSNANLDNGAIPGPRVDDAQLVSGAEVTWRALRREGWRLDLGYGYDREDPLELQELARDRHRGEGTLVVGLSDRVALTLDGDVWYTSLDGEHHYTGWRVGPGVFIGLGPRAGWLRLFTEAGQDRFRDTPRLSSLERDADVYGAGVEHVVPVPGWTQGFASLRLGGVRNDTRASEDALGFRGAYDHTAAGARLRLRGPLALGFSLDSAIGWEGAWFDHPNLVDALTRSTLSPPRRQDDAFWSRVSLVRPLHRWVEIELAWRHFDRRSNVNVYDVRSDVVGAYLTLTAW